MVLLLGSLGLVACLLASCYAEVEEVAARGAPNPASRLPRMRPGGRAAPARSQYRMSYHAEEDPRQLRAQHQQQMMQQATRQPQRQHRSVQREDRKERHAQAPVEQRGRPRPQQQARQGQRQRGVAQQIMVRTRRQQPERGPEVAVVRRRRKVPRDDEMGYEEERRPVAQRQPRRRPRADGEHAGSPRRAFRHHQEDLMEAGYEMEQYEDDGYAQPRQRRGHRAQELPEEDYGRQARRQLQGGRGQREMGPRDENEVMAEAIRLLQAQEGAGIGTPNNPFGLPVMDDEAEQAPTEEEEEEEEEVVNDDFLVKPRKHERMERGQIRMEAAAIADDDGESDSLRIPMPDWMLYAGRIVDDASTHDQIFTTPDKVVQTSPAAANVAKTDGEMPVVVVKAEDEVAIPKRSFLKPAKMGW